MEDDETIILAIEQKRVIKKMVTVLNLVNAYHSTDGSDIQDNIRELMKEELILDFNKHLHIYLKNGHTEFDSITKIKDAHDALYFAQCSFIKSWN